MNWINAVFYQATWFAAVAGAGHGWWWSGLLVFAVFAAWQLATSTSRQADVGLIVGAALLGFVVDSIFIQCGFLHYASAQPWSTLAPVWIVTLWMSFALTLNHSLAILQKHVWLAAVLGGIGAPLAYLAAAHAWNAVVFSEPQQNGVIAIGVAWTIVTPLLIMLARHLQSERVMHAPVLSSGAH